MQGCTIILVTPFETGKISDDDSIEATRTRTMFMYLEGVRYMARLCMMMRTMRRTGKSHHHLARATTPGRRAVAVTGEAGLPP